MPEAPGWFSTTTVWPRARETPSLRRRAITSVAAPGPVGTRSLIGRFGQLCAWAWTWVEAAASTSRPQQSNARLRRCTASSHNLQAAVYYRGRQSQAEEARNERRVTSGRQRPARHPAGGVRDLRRPARQVPVLDAGRRGRAAPALDQP